MAAAKRLCCRNFGLEPGDGQGPSKLLRTDTITSSPDTLLDICARKVAENIPFQVVEERCQRIPEPVQSRIVYWSFPRNERDIEMYSSFSSDGKTDDTEKLPFYHGLKLLASNGVDKVLQIGFHLSGTVNANPGSSDGITHRVSLNFDRCKITSVSCSCERKDIFWCCHVVALAIYRIRNADIITLRVPISETLLQMNREQLQKFAQYLISEHHSQILPTAQSIADEILSAQSEINQVYGAPDPTAGASTFDQHSWHLDEGQVREQVKVSLGRDPTAANDVIIQAMFSKVREMLIARDSNGARMLQLITEEFLNDSRLMATSHSSTGDKSKQLWDDLGCLWVDVVLNPLHTQVDCERLATLLNTWIRLPSCPSIEPSQHSNQHSSFLSSQLGSQPGGSGNRTVFDRALEASRLNWSAPVLQQVLSDSCPSCMCTEQWHRCQLKEPLQWSCARVSALLAHGFNRQALQLAVVIVYSMKKKQQSLISAPVVPLKTPVPDLGECKVSLKNTLCLVKTLVNRCLTSSQCCSGHHYSYLCLALQAGLMGLGQVRMMPGGAYAQERILKEEEELLSQLKDMKVTERMEMRLIVEKQANLLLKGGYWSCLDPTPHKDTIPCHAFAEFLFSCLLFHNQTLAYNVGLRALRFPILAHLNGLPMESSTVTRLIRPPGWHTLQQLEAQQCHLAATLITSAKDMSCYLYDCVVGSKKHIYSPTQLFKLAQEVLKVAISPDSHRHIALMNVAQELGLQVLRMTLTYSVNWRRREMVRWLVTCATELGVDCLIDLMKNWELYLTPSEATSSLANTVMSTPVLIQLGLNYQRQKELTECAQDLALHCCRKDPANCSITAITLCEKDIRSFETAYHIIKESAMALAIGPDQLFALARFMEQRSWLHRAYTLCILAVRQVRISCTQDTHPAVTDVHWSCALCHTLGKTELTALINVLVKNVQCATVLSDVLRRCSLSVPSFCEEDQRRRHTKMFTFDKPPLNDLLEAAIRAYVNTTHSRLTHISPRHYGDFLEFLSKARDTFLLARDGHLQFGKLIENMKLVYKGKKKLMYLVTERFGILL